MPKLIFNVDEITGNKSNGFGYEMTLAVKNSNQNLLYELKCSDIDKTKHNAKLELIGAHNLKDRTGGYGIKALGMDTLLQQFKSVVVIPLRNHGVILDPNMD